MRSHFKKSFIALAFQLLLVAVLFYSRTIAIATREPVIKIVDAKTGSSSISLGSESEPMPLGGYPLTVNVMLEGLAERLFTYQIAVSFDKTKVKCTAAWIPKDDPNFVFFGKRIIKGEPSIAHANIDGYVYLGVALQNVSKPIDVSQGIFCQINFTAMKTGTFALDVIPTRSTAYPDDTFLMNPDLSEILFTSESFSVTVLAFSSPPVASFTFNPTNPKVNQTVTFDASESYDPDGEIVVYVWNFGDGTKETTTNTVVLHVFARTGVYHVIHTVFDNDGLDNSVAYDVLVGEPPFANFNYYPVEPWPYRGDTVTFNASESFDLDGYITNYVWNFGDGAEETTTTATVTHVFDRNGIYDAELTIFDNDGLHSSKAVRIFVGIRPVAEFIFWPESPNPDEEVFFNAYGNDGNRLTYDLDGEIVYVIWDFGDLNVIEVNVSNPAELVVGHVYAAQGGVYTVNLTVFDDDGLYISVLHDVNVTVIQNAEQEHTFWEGYAAAGIVLGAIITVSIWHKKRPEKESQQISHRVF